MFNQLLLCFCYVLYVSCSVPIVEADEALPPPPHIVLIMADDVGWNDVSFHGSDQIPTPHIDCLAYHGVLLHRHYTQPVCTPSRASLLTGKYPLRTGTHNGFAPHHRTGLGLSEKLLPQYLKELGYSTHLVGKWHLGFYKRAYTPLARGFDSHFGFWTGAINYFNHTARSSAVLTPPDRIFFTGLDLRRNYTPVRELEGQYLTDLLTREAVHVVEQQPSEQPLFLFVAHLAGHTGSNGEGSGLQALEDEVRQFSYIQDPDRRTYAAMISRLDQSVGAVVEALDQRGMLNNSVIVFLSDNGAPNVKSSNSGSNYPWRGQKQTVWEGGVRTPALIWSPLLARPSRVSHSLMHVSDWLPTLLAAAGYDTSRLEDIDGVNQWLTLSQDLPTVRENLIIDVDNEKNTRAAIMKSFKYVKGPIPPSASAEYSTFLNLDTINSPDAPGYNVTSTKTWSILQKYAKDRNLAQKLPELRRSVTESCTEDLERTVDCTSEACLFNLENDPCEQNDIASAFPTILNKLERLLDLYKSSAIPDLPLVTDPNSNPDMFNETWSIWIE